MFKHWAKYYVDEILIRQVDLFRIKIIEIHKVIKFTAEKENKIINQLDLILTVSKESTENQPVWIPFSERTLHITQ